MADEGGQSRAHQQMAAVDQKGDRNNQQDMRRRGPELDGCEFRSACKVQSGHQGDFDDAEAFLCGLRAQNQRIGNNAKQNRQTGCGPATEFRAAPGSAFLRHIGL